LHPWLSNLLPEGALRDWLAQGLKVHPDNEFPLIAQLGHDLPGAIEAEPVVPDYVPEHVLVHRTSITPVVKSLTPARGFSLAGVQMKFSMREREGRFHFGHEDVLGNWIVKTPSTRHRGVPANEFTAMTLAQAAGIEIPEIRMVELSALDALPDIALPQEPWAYAIKRYDRDGDTRVHTEDMAQVLFQYPHQKYSGANYEQLGKLLRDYTRDGLAALQQFARRLLVNLLLANGDAHLKNWSLLYPDRINPVLSPAYDIVFTRAWIADEQEVALNLNGTKRWYEMGWADFEAWSRAVGTPWPAIRVALNDSLAKARERWPDMLEESPMLPQQKAQLRHHWRKLLPEFRIG